MGVPLDNSTPACVRLHFAPAAGLHVPEPAWSNLLTMGETASPPPLKKQTGPPATDLLSADTGSKLGSSSFHGRSHASRSLVHWALSKFLFYFFSTSGTSPAGIGSGSHSRNSCKRVLTVSGHSIITMWLPSSITFKNAMIRICERDKTAWV